MIHLDFFSGIGSATMALLRLGIAVRHVLSWEVDEVARGASKPITKSQRGNLLDDDPASVAKAVESVPNGAADLLVMTAAPPARTSVGCARMLQGGTVSLGTSLSSSQSSSRLCCDCSLGGRRAC